MSGLGEQYICAHCGGQFTKPWTDEEARAEYEANFPILTARGDDVSMVCDTCYQAIITAYRDSGLREDQVTAQCPSVRNHYRCARLAEHTDNHGVVTGNFLVWWTDASLGVKLRLMSQLGSGELLP